MRNKTLTDDGVGPDGGFPAAQAATQRPIRQGAVHAVSRWARIRGRLEACDRTMRRLLRRASPMLLRISLGIVFVWFGTLKVAGTSAVGGLVAATVPFLDSAWFVPLLGVVEILIGVAFATGRLLRVVLPVFAAHMAGTFLVLLTLPDVAFQGANPLVLTAVGEFVVKNLVLLSAGLVVASGVKPLRARTARTGERSRPAEDTEEEDMTRGSITRLVLWVAALALAATGCASQGSAGAPPSVEGPAVAVRDYEFEPTSLTVETGATVTWVWEGRAPHDVVSQGFESEDQSSGTFSHRFEQPGMFAYECTIHPGMEGSIVVRGGKPE